MKTKKSQCGNYCPNCLETECECPSNAGCSNANIYEALTIQALRIRSEIYQGGGLGIDEFDANYLDGLGEHEKEIAKREGISIWRR